MIGFDTLHAAETLTEAGIDAIQAKAIVAAMSEAVGEPITRADLEPLATRAETRAELEAAIRPLATKAELEAAIKPLATKAEFEPLATKVELAAVRAEIIGVRTAIAEQQATLTWRIVLALGAFATLVRLIP